MRKIFYKIFGGYLIVVILLIAIILFLSYRTIKEFYIQSLNKDLTNLNHSLVLRFEELVADQKYSALDSLVKRIGSTTATRVTVINLQGRVLADSENNPDEMENHSNRPEIAKAMEGKLGNELRFSTTLKRDMLYVAIPIRTQNNKLIGVSRTAVYLRDIEISIRNLIYKIAQISIFTLIISVTGILFLSRSISKPIIHLARAARRVASGDFDVKVFLKNKDEIKDLSESFNYMIEEIKNLFDQISIKKEELNSIISSIRDALLVMDDQGRIVLFNEGFVDITGSNNLEERYFWEVIREDRFGGLVNRIISDKSGFTDEIELNYRHYLCSFNWIDAKDEIVVILYDITDLKKLELVKRDFINNVSHELRTPLTAIKGFIETLEFEVDDESRHYLQIMQRHTNRLIAIVQDLLDLSNLEEPNFKLELADVNIIEIMPYVLKLFEDRLVKKGLHIKMNVSDEPIVVRADQFKLEQIFINLIDNAIKYSDSGGVDIGISKSGKFAKIEIKDSGIGIPKDKINRVFERFYIVDKSRSRKVGGTGLGLSIVKHIVMLHKGSIDLQSTVGSGTIFTIQLPLEES